MKTVRNRKRDKRQKKLERTTVRISLAPNTPVREIPAMRALEAAAQARDAEHYESAKFICQQLLGYDYVSIDASIIMLEISIEQRQPADTHEFCERLLKSAPQQLHAVIALAMALRNLNRHEQALRFIRKALKAHPSSCVLRNLHAGYLIEIGEKDEAEKELRVILKLDKKYAPAYLHLAALDALKDEEVDWLENLDVGAEDSVTRYTALATTYRKRRDVDKEFKYLNLAQRGLADYPSRPSSDLAADIETTIKVFDEKFFRANRPVEKLDHTPIFIMGMPRSGSTLTEQLLQTSDDVDGIGETSILHCIVQDLCRRRFGDAPFLEAAQQFNHEDYAEIADRYVRQVRTIYTEAPVSINKQLRNYMYIGVLHVAFPNAKFIHTLRHPLDNCLSCYQQVFDRMDESRNLDTLAQTYIYHLRMLDHWKRHLGGRIFTAQYEDMIKDPENQSKALLEFCGIPWTEDVLNFHQRKTAVKTASVMQVRKPIYSSAVEKWRRYEKHLHPAMRVLDIPISSSGN